MGTLWTLQLHPGYTTVASWLPSFHVPFQPGCNLYLFACVCCLQDFPWTTHSTMKVWDQALACRDKQPNINFLHESPQSHMWPHVATLVPAGLVSTNHIHGVCHGFIERVMSLSQQFPPLSMWPLSWLYSYIVVALCDIVVMSAIVLPPKLWMVNCWLGIVVGANMLFAAYALEVSFFSTHNEVLNTIHPIAPYDPRDTHKLMGFYMEVLILGVIL